MQSWGNPCIAVTGTILTRIEIIFFAVYIKLYYYDGRLCDIVRMSKLLLVTSVIFYVIYDVISTLAAFNYLGSFEYEKSMLIKFAFDLAGIPGFIGVKVALSMIAILIAYSLIQRYEKFRGFGKGVLAGATLSGLFVGTSNFNIVLNGSSIWLMGMDSGTIAAVIILGCSFAGYVSTRRGYGMASAE